MKKIDYMTPEQENQMIAFREEWRAIGLATGKANLDAIRPILTDFYKAINKATPYLWNAQSPLQANLVINILRANPGANLWDNLGANLWANLRANLWANLGDNLGDNLRANLGANLWDNLGDNLGANLWANLRANLRANLGANLWDNLGDNLWANLGDNLGENLRANLGENLRANLWANLWDNLWANLWDNLGDNLWANLGENLRANLWANLGDNLNYIYTSMLGSGDSFWIAYYLFPHLHIRPMHSDAMRLLNQWGTIAQNAFWWYPFENICFICDRPTEYHFDEKWRLHNETGPAVAFSDGYSLFAHHGVMLPAWIIEHPDRITPKTINEQTNAEIRRVMMGKFGWEKMFDVVDAKLIDSHPDPTIGELWH